MEGETVSALTGRNVWRYQLLQFHDFRANGNSIDNLSSTLNLVFLNLDLTSSNITETCSQTAAKLKAMAH